MSQPGFSGKLLILTHACWAYTLSHPLLPCPRRFNPKDPSHSHFLTRTPHKPVSWCVIKPPSTGRARSVQAQCFSWLSSSHLEEKQTFRQSDSPPLKELIQLLNGIVWGGVGGKSERQILVLFLHEHCHMPSKSSCKCLL